MESFDRSLDTLMTLLESRVKVAAGKGKGDGGSLKKAVERTARTIHALKVVSRLCTHLNADRDDVTCEFYSSERDHGLNDGMLFAALSPEYDGVELASVPALQYWNVFLSRLLAEASGTADAAKWNKVAKGIQFLAIKPMTACIERHVDSKFCDSIAARALLQHLKALTGPAENSSMKALKKTDYRRLPFLANDTDVRHITENESMVYDAILLHQRYFSGPVEDMTAVSRTTFCETIQSLTAFHGPEVARVVQDAMKSAGDAGRRDMVPVHCNPGRNDYVHDECMIAYAVHVLSELRAFKTKDKEGEGHGHGH